MDHDSTTELSEVKSSAYPDLERVPGKQNWVDHAGGLPKYIERIAKHLHYEKGFPIGTAIAIAVNTVKRWATAGSVTKTGKGAGHQVTAATRAKAAKAVAEWEAKKAKGKISEAAADEAAEGADALLEAELLEAAAEPGDPVADVAKYLSRNFDHPKEVAEALAAATLYEAPGPHMTPQERDSVRARLESRLNILEGIALSLAGDDERARSLAVANGYHLLSPGTKAVKLNEVLATDEVTVRGLFAQMAPEMDGLREAVERLTEAELSYKARKALPASDFVFPDERRYPIHDESHARSALSMVARHGSDDEKAKVRAAVEAKYPEIGMEEADTVADFPQTMFRGKGRCEDCGHAISKHDEDGKCADCDKAGAYRAYEAQEGWVDSKGKPHGGAPPWVGEKGRRRNIGGAGDSINKAVEDAKKAAKKAKEAKKKKKHLSEACNCWKGYCRVPGTKPCAPGSCKKCDAGRVKAELNEAMRGQREKGTLPPVNPGPKDQPEDQISAEARQNAEMLSERVRHLQSRLDSLGFEAKDDGHFGPKTEKRVREFQMHAGLVQDGIVGPNTTAALRLAPGPDEMLAVAAKPSLVPQAVSREKAPEPVDPKDAENAAKPTGDSTGQEKETKAKVEEGLADGFGSETEMGPTIMPDDLNLMNPVQPVEVPPKEKKPRSKPKPPPAMFKGVGVGDTRSNPHVKELQGDLKTVGYNVVEDGRFGPETEQATKRFQRKYGLNPDGVVGPKTLRTIKGVKKHLATIDEALMDQELAADGSEWQEAHDRLVSLKRDLAEAEKKGESVWPELEESVRGDARKAAAHVYRMPDGTFAPKGSGQVLQPGDPVNIHHETGVHKGSVQPNTKLKYEEGPEAGKKERLSPKAGGKEPVARALPLTDEEIVKQKQDEQQFIDKRNELKDKTYGEKVADDQVPKAGDTVSPEHLDTAPVGTVVEYLARGDDKWVYTARKVGPDKWEETKSRPESFTPEFGDINFGHTIKKHERKTSRLAYDRFARVGPSGFVVKSWPTAEQSARPEDMRDDTKAVQEAATAVRGAARKAVQLKRLPDGTFAPKGMGRVLTLGDKVVLPKPQGAKEAPEGFVSAVGSVNKVELTTGPRKGDEVKLADGAMAAEPPLGPVSRSDLDALTIGSDIEVDNRVWTKVESSDHQFKYLNSKNHGAGFWQSEDDERMSSEELALLSSGDFYTDPDDLPGGPPMSPGTLDLSNYGPKGELRNVKAMGLPKLEALSNHPDVDPDLKVRVDARLKEKGHPELIGGAAEPEQDAPEAAPDEPAEPESEMSSPDEVEKAIKDSIEGKPAAKKPAKKPATAKPPKDGATMQKAIYKKTPLMPVGATLSADKGDWQVTWTKTGEDEWTRSDTGDTQGNADFTGGSTKWTYSEAGGAEADQPASAPATGESGYVDNIGPDALAIKDMEPGQKFMASSGDEFEYHKPAAKPPWHIVKPVGWTEENDLKAKPMHGEMAPPKIMKGEGGANDNKEVADDTEAVKAPSAEMDEEKVDSLFAEYQQVKDGDATPETKERLDELWNGIVAEMAKEDPAIGLQMESVPPHDNDPKWQDVQPKKSAKDKAMEIYKAAGGNDPAVIDALKVAEAAGCDFGAALALVEAFSAASHPRAPKGSPGGGRFVQAGSKGEPVKRVQSEVGEKATGKWDDKTTAAVKAYQKAHGLLVDGIVGAQTWASFSGKKAAPGELPAEALKEMKKHRQRKAIEKL